VRLENPLGSGGNLLSGLKWGGERDGGLTDSVGRGPRPFVRWAAIYVRKCKWPFIFYLLWHAGMPVLHVWA
jgi:hypothetical protein